MSLRLSKDLAFRDEFMLMSAIVLGMPETGKTTFAKKVCEGVWKIKQRFGAIDPKGDYYGLGSSADGQSPGIPVVVFGGEHAHVPLDPKAGQYIANVVVRELDQPFVIDLEKFSKTKQIVFVADFLEELYHINRDPLLMVIDELQRFAPEKASFPEHPRCMGAVEDVFKLGRKHGLGRIGLTQRGAEANKSVTDTCDLLAAFRATGVLDQKRVKGWLDANVGADEAAKALEHLSSLDQGEAIIASARKEIKVFKVVQIDRLETFDTSATPGLKRRRREPKVLAQPDLRRIEEKMTAELEREAAADPVKLRTKIRDLEKQLQQRPMEERVVEKRVEVLKPFLDEKLMEETTEEFKKTFLTIMDQAMQEAQAAMGKTADRIMAAAKKRVPVVPPAHLEAIKQGYGQRKSDQVIRSKTPFTVPAPARAESSNGSSEISAAGQKILNAIGWLESVRITEPDRTTVGAISGYSAKSGHFKNTTGALRSADLITYPNSNALALTDEGRKRAVIPETPPTTNDLHAVLLGKLDTAQQKILGPLLAAGGRPMSREELGEVSGYSHTSGHFKNVLGSLRSMRVVEYPDSQSVRASDLVFID